MNVDDIPPELVALLDARAGRKHTRDGTVLRTLAELLTLFVALQEAVPVQVGDGRNMRWPTRRPARLGTYQPWPCGACGCDVDDSGPHNCRPPDER